MESTSAEFDLIVAGAGPAGSACAITAARAGRRVLLLDKDRFPRHKVCGEFVSAESLHLLRSLLDDQHNHEFAARPGVPAARIFLDGKSISFPVTPAARSIPRFDLDAALVASARQCGIRVEEGDAVRWVAQNGAQNGAFTVRTAEREFTATAVVNATGRWSQLTQYDVADGKKDKWIGLKAHFREQSPPHSVDLYFFSGGYCGVTPVDPQTVNACAMVQAGAARSLEEVFAAHPELWKRSRNWRPVFSVVTTSPLYFRKPETCDQGMLLAGDAAGFIDPFAGDGISLALHGGALAAESLLPFFAGELSLEESQRRYHRAYLERFAPAFRNAARLRALLAVPQWIRSRLFAILGTRPVASLIVRRTRARV
ncbi:MAG TPA: NAD(P)/FAD-dependent oxidoreductase [Candidatus Angelobacter sp.]|nr:NAD(P)/FAD-dependent oxidoreductase [Candidatus Angelobacter sp.]